MTGKKRMLPWVLPGLAVLLSDRAVKAAVLRGAGGAEEAPVLNSGMAFGMLQGNAGVILILSLALAALCFFLLRGMRLSGLAPVALSMLLGGAAGNMIDRLMYGSVIDMIPFFGWFVFNLADAGVVAGAILCGWSLLFRPQDWSGKKQ